MIAAGWRRTAYLAAAALGLSTTVADAGCLHTAQLYSCVDASGKTTQYYCFGSGSVLTCMNFSGGWLLVAPHELLSQVTTSMDSQLSSALAADAARSAPAGTPGTAAPHGFAGTTLPQPGVHP